MIIETFSPFLAGETKTDAANSLTFTGRSLAATTAPPAAYAAPTWTVECAGVEKSCEAWGIATPVGNFLSLATDTVAFDVEVDAFDGAAPFAYNAWLSIYQNRLWNGTVWTGGTRWFYGRVSTTPRTGLANRESMSYTLAGVWECLERRVFEQPWRTYSGGVLISTSTSHLYLATGGNDTQGAITMVTTAAQIRSILDWCRLNGDPFLIGTIPTGIYVPIDEVRDLVCSECIRKMLRWQPDACSWVDYSTTPPTINFARRADLSPVTFAIGTKPLSAINITRRDDLLVPCVVLKYERVDETNNVPQPYTSIDKWPVAATGYESGAFKASIDLKGFQANYVSAPVEVSLDIPGSVAAGTVDTNAENWWKGHFPYLSTSRLDPEHPPILISCSVRPAGYLAYPRELTRGQLADWMTHTVAGVKTNVIGRQESLTATFEETTLETTGAGSKARKTVSLNIITTNALAPASGQTYRNYSTIESSTEGDLPPTGLAQAMYECLSTVQFSGSIELTEQEVCTALAALSLANRPGVGLCVNLLGGHADWHFMRAMVQSCSVDAFYGKTVFAFGPPAHLGIPDLIELLRVTRTRQIYNNPRMRGGSLASSTRVGLGKDTAATNTDGGAMSSSYQKLAAATANYIESDPIGANPAVPVVSHKLALGATTTGVTTASASGMRSTLTCGSKIIDLNTADITGNRTVKMREWSICVAGVTKKIQIPSTEAY